MLYFRRVNTFSSEHLHAVNHNFVCAKYVALQGRFLVPVAPWCCKSTIFVQFCYSNFRSLFLFTTPKYCHQSINHAHFCNPNTTCLQRFSLEYTCTRFNEFKSNNTCVVTVNSDYMNGCPSVCLNCVSVYMYVHVCMSACVFVCDCFCFCVYQSEVLFVAIFSNMFFNRSNEKV